MSSYTFVILVMLALLGYYNYLVAYTVHLGTVLLREPGVYFRCIPNDVNRIVLKLVRVHEARQRKRRHRE